MLKILNSNSQNPYLLWDNGTRAELVEYLEERRTNKLHLDTSESCANDFKYSAYTHELRVGDIYIRVYNEQPTFPLEVSENLK